MFEWEYCYGCNEMETGRCPFNGRYWECPYSRELFEVILPEEEGL